MYEKKISPRNLFFEILSHWRALIVAMLIGAIVLGAGGYIQSYRTYKVQLQEMEDAKKQLEEFQKNEEAAEQTLLEKITESQKLKVEKILNYQAMKEYYQKSVYLQMDVSNVPKVQLSFLVRSSALADNSEIERLYEDALRGGLQEWLDEKKQTENISNIHELVSLRRGTGTVESDSFCVQVIHVTESQCRELAKSVVDYIEDLQDKIAVQVGEHEVVLINQTFAFARDSEVLSQQRMLWADIGSAESTIESGLADLSEEEKAYLDFLNTSEDFEPNVSMEDDSDSEEFDEQQDIIAPRFSSKQVVLGMILFAVIYVSYLFLKYIMNRKLQISDDIIEIYGIPQLGCIREEANVKKLFGFVDRFIVQIRDGNQRKFSREEALGLACVALKMVAKRESLDVVGCIGCNIQTDARMVAEFIQNTLCEEGVNIAVLNNVIYDQGAMEQLQKVKGAFLLEKAGDTFYEEIEKELELLKRQDIKILGVVVVE